MATKVIFINLGCPKNQVDLELMQQKLADAGFVITEQGEYADIAVVNTCAFIESAKKESIESVLENIDFKSMGIIKHVIVTGCLAERYRDEIFTEIPEVDGVIGIGADGDIVAACRAVLEGTKVKSFPDKLLMPLEGERMLVSPSFWAYLKIADGCSNCCTYCAIPSIRGSFRSRTEESIVAEAEKLASDGAKELVLIAQDTTRYGEDIYGELRLPSLLKKLAAVEGIEWLRLLYCYPDRITDELIETVATEKKVLHYLDIPMQHADAGILKAMNRRGDSASLLSLLAKIRARIPDVIIRSTLIAGFPGEGEDEFNTLSEFVNEAKLEHMGCFPYSKEEGTPAAKLDCQVEPETAAERAEVITKQQFRIGEELCGNMIGKTLDVLCEGYDRYSDSYFGRSYADAPEIDGQVYFTSGYRIDEGDIIPVEIFSVDESGCDLIGEAV